MIKNKLKTLGYFRQRLHISNISSKILIKDFSQEDKRKWMISIFDDLKIICICYKTNDNSNLFEFFDGKNKIQHHILFNTQSMNVIIEFLNSLKGKED